MPFIYYACTWEEEFPKQNTINHLLHDFLLVLSHTKKQYKHNIVASLCDKLYTRRRGIVFTIIDNYPHWKRIGNVYFLTILKSHYEFHSQREN